MDQMNKRSIKKIPYGISDYVLIRKENYYYVDKTPYLETLENAGRYLFFIRPRRFGKSLFIGLMQVYYDIAYKENYNEFFKGTWVYDHPTPERNLYLVLTLNFAAIDPDLNKIEASFLNHVKTRTLEFIQKYHNLLVGNRELNYYEENIKSSLSSSDILSSLFALCQTSPYKLYLMIDEYDNFSNTILSISGERAYQKLTHGDGFFKSFFNVLKGGTTSSLAPVARTFITGVSPITMDDVTSGYNIGTFVSLDHAFNQTLGFSKEDVIEVLNYYASEGMIDHETSFLMEIIDKWYGNYLFSEYSKQNERMYNSDMILYFLREYFKIKALPNDLIDRNVRIDYGKLRHLIILDKGEIKTTNGNFSKLKTIIENGAISTQIVKGFPLEKLTSSSNFTSLLFYFGLLTINGVERDKVRLEIPNETVRRLFYDYIEEAYRETSVFSLDLDKYSNLMTSMAYDGKWEPLFGFFTSEMQKSMCLRDLITEEKSIQAFLNVYLGLSNLYIIHPEKELNKGFSDIVMEPFIAKYNDIGYSYILEIKYFNVDNRGKGDIKASIPSKKVIEHLKSEAKEQLLCYSLDEKFKKSIGKTTLKKLLLIFAGHELVLIEELDSQI